MGMMGRINWKYQISFILAIFLLSACNYQKFINPNFRVTYPSLNQKVHMDSLKTAYLKVHVKDGSVYLLDCWELAKSNEFLSGTGKKFNYNRSLIREGDFEIPVTDIVIMETNNIQSIKSLDMDKYASLAVFTILNALGGIMCLSNPKACFGSCPTFYIDDDVNAHLFSADAEGFSEAIAPSLERWDLDALQCQQGGGQLVKLWMKMKRRRPMR